MNRRQSVKRPVSKATAALNEQLARKRGVRDLAKRVLIVCEDQKSAVNYFEALKAHFRLTASAVEVVGSGGKTQPQQVLGFVHLGREHCRELYFRPADTPEQVHPELRFERGS